ncbi:tRNA lysidine(34) synthetase TilS [Alteromonas sp. C1M14]|uniref:tRNA lysidine(34) synthetase TilS n=1 Tax=Alteromonas sp. C1M14 TaxID=2841567 RepID=UPI001C093836|nr:tRNA lysidine(34) synthetase TilS [Alteromonas sp. C1M14]MBU2977878.1 tRNA lysidine(34) synthetase TilS [Alteromonas sp. C1M14]
MTSQTDPTSLLAHIAKRLSGLLNQLDTPPATLVVGFSGGVDSTVLLHGIADNTSLPVHAVYINHGLSKNALHWQQHCQQYCQQHNIPFHAIAVDVSDAPRRSLEAQARDARYAALTEYCERQQGALLLGQHQDDQLETMLLALKRGSGPLGLAAMSEVSFRNRIAVLRPLLTVSRTDIEQAARHHHLTWIEDESNQDTQFDRNFLRNDIIPLLTNRWPQLGAAAQRSSHLLQEHNAMLNEVVEAHFRQVAGPNQTLFVNPLMKLDARWQRAVCRYWLASNSRAMPSQAQLGEMLRSMQAKEDAQPVVQIGQYSVRRYGNALYICEALPEASPTDLVPGQWVQLPWWNTPLWVDGPGTWQAVPLTVLPKVYCAKRNISKASRKWLKEWQVPPWERNNVPAVLNAGEPVAVILKETIVELQFDISEKVKVR